MPKPAVRESPKQMMSCADGGGLCVAGAGGPAGDGAGEVAAGAGLVAVDGVGAGGGAGLQPVTRAAAARDVRAAKAIVDRLEAARGWVTVPF